MASLSRVIAFSSHEDEQRSRDRSHGVRTHVVVFALREARLEEEVASLRGTLARIEEAQQAAAIQVAPVALAASPVPTAPGSVPDADWSDRLAAIERDMEAMIASHNQSVDELTRLLAREKKARMRSWGPEQATGEPDTTAPRAI